MKTILVFLLSISGAFGNTIKIKINPEQPVYNETFNIEVTLKLSEELENEPIINFKPYDIEIISRSDPQTSTRISYINGRSSIERTYKVVYEAVAASSGYSFLRDIKVEVNNKTLKHPTVKFKVLKTANKAKNIFVKAVLDKTKAYVGESILIRYYVYARNDISVRNTEFKTFPKLDKFLKRFYQEPSVVERVQIDGKMYRRKLIYTAQVFADKPGEYKVDPIRSKIYYVDSSSGYNSFGFNLNMGRSRIKTLSSEIVKVEVIPLPGKGMEKHFTGLVGKHSFKLVMSKSKYIANEPIEINLKAKGVGALELLEAPVLINDPSFEEFNKSSDFRTLKDFSSEKSVNYTYLGRENITIEATKIPLSYFDPVKIEYVTVYLDLGEITVAGSASGTKSKIGSEINPKDEQGIKNNAREKIATSYDFKPLLKISNTFLYNIYEILMFIIFWCVSIYGYLIYKKSKNMPKKTFTVYEEIYKRGLTYANLHKALVGKNNERPMKKTLEEIDISENAKNYFIQLIDELNYKYSNNTNEKVVKINKTYFKELERYYLDENRQNN